MPKLYLVQFEGHSYTWSHHPVQQVHVCKNPLVSRRGDTKVALEQGMKAVEKRLQAKRITKRISAFTFTIKSYLLKKKVQNTTMKENHV